MSLYRQDDRDGLVATLKARQDKYKAHANSSDPSLRTPVRLQRLAGHVDEAQAQLAEHVRIHGRDGKGPSKPDFGIYAVFGDDMEQIFVENGRPLTMNDIARVYRVVNQEQKQ